MLKIDPLLQSYGSVPTIPRVMAHLLTELDQPAPDMDRIKRFFAADPGLTCRILQVANAANDSPDHVAGTDEAVDLLGLTNLHMLGRTVAEAAPFIVVPGINLRQFWRISLNTAKVSRSLAQRVEVDPTTAFTSGMIHAVGEVIMHLGMPYEMRILDERVQPFRFGRARAEEKIFGYSYATVAAEFARKWRFPDTIIVALRNLPQPFAGGLYDPLIGVLHLAAWRARALEAQFTPEKYASQFPYEIGWALQLDIDAVLEQEAIDWHSTRDSDDTN